MLMTAVTIEDSHLLSFYAIVYVIMKFDLLWEEIIMSRFSLKIW